MEVEVESAGGRSVITPILEEISNVKVTKLSWTER